MRSKRFLALLISALTLVSCSRDPNYLKQQYLTSGNKYFDKGKYKEASIMYRRAIDQDRKWGPGYYHLALTFLRQGSIPSAVPALRRAVELLPPGTPDADDASLKLAEILVVASQAIEKNDQLVQEIVQIKEGLLKRGPNSWQGHKLAGDLEMLNASKDFKRRVPEDAKKDVVAAIEEYRKSLASKPDDTNIALALSRTLVLNGQLPEAENLMKAAVQKNPKNIAPYTELYRIYITQRRIPEAEAISKKAIEQDPKNTDLRLQLAQFYFATNRRDDLVKAINEMKADFKSFPNAYFFAGDFYLRVGQMDDAVKQYEEGIQKDPAKKTEYLQHEVEAYVRGGKADLAFQKNEDILKADPKNSEARALKATFLLDKGDVNTAQTELQSVVTAKPSNFVARFNLGRAHFAKGELEQARQEFDKAIELRPDYLPARLASTEVMLVRGDSEGALRAADSLLKMAPGNVQAEVMKAAALQRLHKPEEARVILKAVLTQNPKQTESLLEMGVLELNEKKYKEAETTFRQAWESNPNNMRGMLGVAEALLQQGQVDRAIQMVQDEANKNPNRADLKRELGNVQMRSGRLDAAVSTFNTLIPQVKEPKQQADLYTRLGEAYARKGEIPKSIESLEKARNADPGNGALPRSIGMLYETSGKMDDARKYYELAVKADPNDPISLNNLAFLMADTNGDLNVALTYAQHAKQKLPNFPEISDTLGWIYLKKNLTDNAIDTFRTLTAQVPQNATYHFHYAMALAQKGEKDKAQKECEVALAQKPKKMEEDKIRDLLRKVS